MNVTVRAAQLFLIVLCVSLCYVITTRKLKMAWALELAAMLLTFAAVGALDAILSDRPFLHREAVAARWLLVGGAAALIIGVIAWRMLRPGHPHRRVEDYVTLTRPAGLDPLARDFGDAPRKRRAWYRWRRGP